MRCDRCEALMINGMFCHETGCPNSGKIYLAEIDMWVRFLKCHECGCEVEEGTACDCRDFFDETEEDDYRPWGS